MTPKVDTSRYHGLEVGGPLLIQTMPTLTVNIPTVNMPTINMPTVNIVEKLTSRKVEQ